MKNEIREPTTKVGSKREEAAAIPEELALAHIPQKVEYGVREIYVDLLNFSARHLVPGGRLAFWLPVNRWARRIDLHRRGTLINSSSVAG